MNRSQLKYYLKQLSKPVSLVALTIGFVGVLIGAGGLLLAVRYGNLLTDLQRQQVEGKKQESTLQLEAEKSNQASLFPIKYQVAPGDSTWKVAEKFYHDGRHYPAIEQANHLQPGQWLEVGAELVIPKLDPELKQASKPAVNEADNSISTSKSYRLEPVSDHPASGEKREKYVVQPGDSLWFISLKYLDSGYKWTELYAQNRQIVGRNPDLIYPGTELVLPNS